MVNTLQFFNIKEGSTTEQDTKDLYELNFFTKFPHVYAFTKQKLNLYDGSHDITHAKRVLCNAYRIWVSERMHITRTTDLVLLAAFTHDTCDHKYGDTMCMAQKLQNAMCLENLRSSEIEVVISVVCNISYSRLKSIGNPKMPSHSLRVWKIVSDADILEAMGATGIMRTLMYQGWKGRNFEEACQYITTNLLECEDYLHTACAKQEGRIRTSHMDYMMKQSKDEHVNDLFQIIYNHGRAQTSFQTLYSVLSNRDINICIPVSHFIDNLRRECEFAQV